MTKAYLLGLLVLPVILGAVFFFTSLANKDSGKPQIIAIIDRTGVSAASVMEAVRIRNPIYGFEQVKPGTNQGTQLLDLSDRIRSGELFLVIDILSGRSARYYTNSTAGQLSAFLNDAVNDGLHRARLAQLGMAPARVADAMSRTSLVAMDLVARNPQTGVIEQGRSVNRLQTIAVPFFLMILLFLTVMGGSSQKLGAIAEDKMQRVFEMLLVSASPFELMMGKVLAALGVSLTGSLVHISVGVLALWEFATLGIAPLHLLPWFFAYLVLDVLMLAAIGSALGSTCGTPQDAQSLQFMVALPILLPMLAVAPIMQQPNGLFATSLSFFPPFTPLVMMLRQSLPGGVPSWQPWVGLTGTAVFAVFTTWAAARIFRIGILSQGKTPGAGELLQWIKRG